VRDAEKKMSNRSSLVVGMSPLRKLLLAVLISVVLAQLAAMAMVARSQVLKAELREAAERSGSRAQAAERSVEAARPQAMTVGYAAPR
jgi:hypothetical protein